MNNPPPWSIAIFAARESITTLATCIQAVLGACTGKVAVVDVLVNGNWTLAEQAKQLSAIDLPGTNNVVIRIWFIPVADKAHTWNEFVHRICPSSEIVYFIDGYAEVWPDALSLMDTSLRAAPEALGVTGIPTSGRSAAALEKQLVNDGGIHGNLYGTRGAVIASLKQSGFRMPLGLYRTDSLFGAVLNFRLNPAQYKWDTARVVAQQKASWNVRRTDWWRPKDVMAWYKRKLRQAQGILENRAIAEHLAVNRRSPATLPRTVSELVNKWISEHPQKAKPILFRYPLTIYAVQQLKKGRNWTAVDSEPILLRQI